jgi:hypothetical protein
MITKRFDLNHLLSFPVRKLSTDDWQIYFTSQFINLFLSFMLFIVLDLLLRVFKLMLLSKLFTPKKYSHNMTITHPTLLIGFIC